MSPLTSAECLAIAERKMAEAKGDRRYGKELEATARAWLVLAVRVAEAEALEKQAEALEVAKLAPDIARTAASSDCCSLKQVADDIRSFQRKTELRMRTAIIIAGERGQDLLTIPARDVLPEPSIEWA